MFARHHRASEAPGAQHLYGSQRLDPAAGGLTCQAVVAKTELLQRR